MAEINFIKVHSSDDNSVIIAKASDIILVCLNTEAESNKDTLVYFDNDSIEAASVNETPDKIYQNIIDSGIKKFVKLHSNDDNSVIIVNTDYISLVTQEENNDKKFTTIYFSDDSIESVTFNESPERVYQMIIAKQS